MRTCKNKRNPFLIAVGIGLAVVLLLSTAVAFCFGTGFEHRYLDLDMALLEMYTRHAADGQQLLGPYSRFGWNHPGPAYFYLLAPLYKLSGDSTTSMFLGARLINLVCALCLLGTIMMFTRESGAASAVWSCLLMQLYVCYLGPEILCSPWNPWIIVLPAALFLVCCAALAAGKPLFLPAVVGIGSFLVQTHVSLLPTVAVIACASLILLAIEMKVRPPHELGPPRRHWFVSVALSLCLMLLLWIPPLIEQVTHNPGNLSKLYRFFADGDPGHTLPEAFNAVSKAVSWLPLLLIRWLPVTVPDFEYEFAGQAFALLQFCLVPHAVWTAMRENQRFQACLGLLGTLGLPVAVWSALQIRGGLFGYLLTWTSAIGFVNWLVLGWIAIDRVVAVVGRWGVKQASMAVAMGLTGIMVLSAAINMPRFVRESLNGPRDAPQVKHLSRSLIDWLKDRGIRRPVVHFDWSNWPTESGIVLQLHKAGIPFAVVHTWPQHDRDGWPLLLGKEFRPSPEDKTHIVFGGLSAPMEHGWEPIGGYGDTVIYGKDDRKE